MLLKVFTLTESEFHLSSTLKIKVDILSGFDIPGQEFNLSPGSWMVKTPVYLFSTLCLS